MLKPLVAPSLLKQAVSGALAIAKTKAHYKTKSFYDWSEIIEAANEKDYKTFCELLPSLLADPDQRRVQRVLKICAKGLSG